MARLTPDEFTELVEELVSFHGLGGLQQKLLRTNLVVSRRLLARPGAISRQLYQLTAGLGREGMPTQVVIALLEEVLAAKLDEDKTKELEAIAERINACLTPEFDVDRAKEGDLRSAVGEYRKLLEERAGERAARLTMVCRAVPAVAAFVRAEGPAGNL